ncbi:hypothetical protein ACLOJK_029528 [Asimina triloba]
MEIGFLRGEDRELVMGVAIGHANGVDSMDLFTHPRSENDILRFLFLAPNDRLWPLRRLEKAYPFGYEH